MTCVVLCMRCWCSWVWATGSGGLERVMDRALHLGMIRHSCLCPRQGMPARGAGVSVRHRLAKLGGAQQCAALGTSCAAHDSVGRKVPRCKLDPDTQQQWYATLHLSRPVAS